MANVAQLSLIQINNFPEVESPEDWIVVSDAAGLGYKISKENFKAFLGTVTVTSPKPIGPTDGAPELDGVYIPTVVGVYPNFGGLERLESDGYVQFIKNGAVYAKVSTPMPQVEIDQEFDDNSTNAIANKVVSEVIGDVEYEEGVKEVVMDNPIPSFVLGSGASDLPSNTRWAYDPSLISNFDYITGIEAYFHKTNGVNLYVYEKSNLSNSIETITLTIPSIGVHKIYFAKKYDPSIYRIFIADGIDYKVLAGDNKVGNILDGVYTPQPDVLLQYRLIGEKAGLIFTPLIKQISDLRSRLPEDFTNNLHKGYSGLENESVNSAYSITGTSLTMTSRGIGNGITLNKQYNLNERYLELKVRFGLDTIFYVGTQFIENNVAKHHIEINAATKKINYFNLDSTNSILASIDIPFDIVANREYYIRFFKLNGISSVEFIDSLTGQSIKNEVQILGQFDKYKFGVVSSTVNPVITSLTVKSIIPERPYIIFYGDSITEGNSVIDYTNSNQYHKAFPHLIGAKLNKPYLVSGRSAGTIAGVLNRVASELAILKPKYAMFTIGTNGGNTEQNLNQIIDICLSVGTIPILNLIPLYDGSSASKNALIQSVVNSRKVMSVRTNVATSVNYDGVTKDNSLFANESGVYIHPNEAGNTRIFEQSLTDVPELYSQAGVII